MASQNKSVVAEVKADEVAAVEPVAEVVTAVVEAPAELVAAVAVPEQVVEVDDEEGDDEQDEPEAEPAVELVPIPTPSPEEFPIGHFAELYAASMGFAETFAAMGMTVEQALVGINSKTAKKVMVIPPATKDGQAEKVYVCPENEAYVIAKLANLPSLRAQFASTVIDKVKAFRATPVWEVALAEYRGLIAAMTAKSEALSEMTKVAGAPFRTELFVDLRDHYEVRPVSSGVAPVAAGTHQRKRRSPSEVKWNLGRYEYPKDTGDGMKYHASPIEGGWGIFENSSGSMVASGTSMSDASKNWYESRGMSGAISTPREWNAVAQEKAAGA